MALVPSKQTWLFTSRVYSCLHRAWQFEIGGDLVVQWLVGPDHQRRVVGTGELEHGRVVKFQV